MKNVVLEDFYDLELVIPCNLQFFADDGADKTEEATPKKLEKAREEGQVAKSVDLVSGVTLMTLFLILKIFIGFLGDKFIETFYEAYGYISLLGNTDFDLNISVQILRRVLFIILLLVLPFFAGALLTGVILNVFQVKWKVSTKPLKPKLDKLDPVKGLKRMFSKDKLFELAKSIVKLIIIFYVVYDTIKDQSELILVLYDYTLWEDLAIVGDLVIGVGIKISAIFIVIGAVDLFYQKMKFKKDMRMTKQEVKDEYKEAEGDPQIKGKRRRKMQEMSMRRMMQAVPEADVVITNPTHFAVALKYDKEKASAPIVVAKGEDYLAQKIKEVAREHDVEIYEDKPLARMLYFNVEIDQEIPPELYEAVAEVLSYVYQLKGTVLD